MLKERINQLLEQFKGVAGIAITNLATGEELYAHNGDQPFIAASAIKTAILLELYDRINAGSIDPLQSSTVTEQDFVGGSGIIEMMSTPKEYTVYDFALLMIIVSDNLATNQLINLVGMEAVNQKMAAIGMKHSALKRKMMDLEARREGRENLLSPRDLALLYQYIYQNKEQYAKVLRILRGQQLNTSLPLLVGRGIAFAHKTGSLDGVSNDAGIFFFKEPLAVAVLTMELPSPMEGRLFHNQIGAILADLYI
ncbi:MAG: class A beta-lactamase-related serine hydrolase [Symbiobacteriaceae bacterium]|nr:class A beta-lactamase-related serine hydrolase [Symbiobacteriaceae bacterium]